MDKLKKYNQKLLAILGTIAVVFLAGVTIAAAFLFIEQQVNRNRRLRNSNAITLEDKRDKQNNKLRDQIITFESPHLIDTANAIYMIPVSTIDLDNPEIANYDTYSNERNSTNFDSYGIQMPKHRSKSYHGSYNNIIIHHLKTNKQLSVFENKVSIGNFGDYIVKDQQYILIDAVSHDTNKDQKLSEKDLSAFFCYDLSSNQLNTVRIDNYSLVNYSPIYDSDQILLKFGFDKNEDGKYDPYKEPVELKTYSVSTNELKDLIDPAMQKKLQKLLDD